MTTYKDTSMEDGTEPKILLFELEPPRTLLEAILSRIALARRRAARIQFIFQTFVFFISGMLMVPFAVSVGRELYLSGFYEYASLVFSADGGFIWASRRELLYSLVESIPALAVLCLILTVGALVWSIRKMVRGRKGVFASLPQTV